MNGTEIHQGEVAVKRKYRQMREQLSNKGNSREEVHMQKNRKGLSAPSNDDV